MNEFEAIALLRKCQPLVFRLLKANQPLPLNSEDRRLLMNFNCLRNQFSTEKLKALGWQAELSPAHLGLLVIAANRENQIKKSG